MYKSYAIILSVLILYLYNFNKKANYIVHRKKIHAQLLGQINIIVV